MAGERLLIGQGEACARLGVSRLTLLAEIDRGHLRYVLVSQRRKFKVADIDAYIEKARRQAAGIAGVDRGEMFGPPVPRHI